MMDQAAAADCACAVELSLTVQLVSVVVPPLLNSPPPAVAGSAGGVAADGAVGQRGRAASCCTAAAAVAGRCAELPLTVQLVSVRVPPSLYRPPPLTGVAAGDRQSRDRRRDTRVDLEHPARSRRR